MLNTDEMKATIEKRVSELTALLQANGYDEASIEVRATPAPYNSNRSLFVYENYDWTPSATNWDGSSC